MKAIAEAALLILGWLLVVVDAVVVALLCADALTPRRPEGGNWAVIIAPAVGLPLLVGFLALPVAGFFRSVRGIGCATLILAFPLMALALWIIAM